MENRNTKQEDKTNVENIPQVEITRSRAQSSHNNKRKSRHESKVEDFGHSLGSVFLRSSFEAHEDSPGGIRANEDEELTGTSYIGHQEQEQLNTTNYGGVYIWYMVSPRWRRFTLEMLALLCFILIIQALAFMITIYWIFNSPWKDSNPYDCPTESCLKTRNWLKSSMNTSVDPCDDFYEYVCGNFHIDTHEASIYSKSANEYKLLRTVISDVSEKSLHGEIFRNADQNPIFQQITTFYHSCMNYTSRNEVGEAPFVKLLHEMGLDLDNSTAISPSETLYRIWRYTGYTGFFPLKLYVNPYDGYRKVLVDASVDSQNLYDSYRFVNPHPLLTPEVPEFEYACQEIVRIMKIRNYSIKDLFAGLTYFYVRLLNVQNMGKYFHKNYLDAQEVVYTPTKDIYDVFNCDTFSKKLSDTFGNFDHANLFKEYPIPPDRYVSIGLDVANFICNGELTRAFKMTPNRPDVDKIETDIPTWTSEKLYKIFWIFFLFYEEINNLSPATAMKFSEKSKFFESGFFSRGDACRRSLKKNMPHLVHERLMQVLKVTPERIEEAQEKYSETHRQLRRWINDPKREKTFGKKILALYRQVIDSYRVKLISPRFSIEELETLGYKKTAKQMDPNKYLENLKILGKSLGDSEIERWNRNNDHYFPVPPFRISNILATLSHKDHVFRPNPIHLAIIPARLYSDLFYDEDVMALRYGGIWSYLTQMTVDQWIRESDNNGAWREELKEEVDFVKSCTRIKGITTEKIDFFTARKGYPRDPAEYWLDLTFELLFEAFKEEKEKSKKKFEYKTLPGMDYTEEQLLFLTLTRHQCAAIQEKTRFGAGEISNSDKLRTGFSRSPTFRKVWNCKPGSPMHPFTKCFFNE